MKNCPIPPLQGTGPTKQALPGRTEQMGYNLQFGMSRDKNSLPAMHDARCAIILLNISAFQKTDRSAGSIVL